MMLQDLDSLIAEVTAAAAAASSTAELRELEANTLGKTGPLMAAKKQLGSLPADDRRDAGRALNDARTALEAAIESRRGELARAERAEQLANERMDLTEVTGSLPVGHLHIVSQAWEALEDVFVGMGFRWPKGLRSRPTGTISAR
ncbi:MAG: hypothetical protein R2710_07180 [Acidimicrobiales bacterium]